MVVRFGTPEITYQFLRDVIGFKNVDEYITDMIERDERYGKYTRKY